MLPVLLDLPAARLRPYARDTVIAEKFQAMVMPGHANSRMKGYYDIRVLSRTHAFAGDRLARVTAATCAADSMKRRQWKAFAADLPVTPEPFDRSVDDLAAFLMAHAAQARTRLR